MLVGLMSDICSYNEMNTGLLDALSCEKNYICSLFSHLFLVPFTAAHDVISFSP